MRLVVVSDVTTGYGSPQILAMARSLRAHYRVDDATIVEPDDPDLHAGVPNLADMRLIRVRTADHPHKTTTGRIEYVLRAADAVNELQPDILVIVTTFVAPLLFHIKRRPELVIYYQLEPVDPYGRFDVQLNRRLACLIDVNVYVEENRAAFDIARFGDRGKPFVVLYNCSTPEQPPLPHDHRNGRLIYHGVIEEGHTYAEYFLSEEMSALPLDLYGRFGGPNSNLTRKKFEQNRGSVRYVGLVDSRMLSLRRRSYVYSIVAWNPVNRFRWSASPNKFFESIASGVPPIVAPHPQCKMLVERYGCGILMDGWEKDDFLRSIRYAMSLYGTSEYQSLVANCALAARRELNWDHQFGKLAKCLDESFPILSNGSQQSTVSTRRAHSSFVAVNRWQS